MITLVLAVARVWSLQRNSFLSPNGYCTYSTQRYQHVSEIICLLKIKSLQRQNSVDFIHAEIYGKFYVI